MDEIRLDNDLKVGETGFKDLVLSPQMYVDMKRDPKQVMSLTGFLEKIDPSEQYHADPVLQTTDAFQRQLIASGIVPYSNPVLGIWADTVGRFRTSDKENSEVLFPEFIRRVWEAAQQPMAKIASPEQARFYMSNAPISDVLYPAYLSTLVRQKQVEPAIPLALLVAITTPVDSEVYQPFRLTDDVSERQYTRVPEGAPVPTAILTGADVPIRLKKYGRRLIGSYETFRRMRIDRFALHLALLAVQVEVDKVATAIDVLISGDGNTGTPATNTDLTGLTGGVSGDPKVQQYFEWRMLWPSPYNCQILLAQSDDIATLLMMDVGSANVMFGQIGGLFGGALGTASPINPQLSGIGIGWHASVTADRWLGIDNRFALEMVVEIGADLVETDKIIASQFNEIVMTEVVGFTIFDVNTSRTLTLNA